MRPRLRLKTPEKENSDFKSSWKLLSEKTNQVSKNYFAQTPFCDLKVFETLIKSFPANANIQYGNSTPIRYSNLFPHKNSLTVNANRGTSGIDGCVSTAAGAAYANNKLTISVVGDISFFYDSNALWNNYLSPNFRIIIINNPHRCRCRPPHRSCSSLRNRPTTPELHPPRWPRIDSAHPPYRSPQVAR